MFGSPSGEIGEDFVDGPIGDILVHAVPTLPEGEGDLVAHAKQLGKAQHTLLNVKLVILGPNSSKYEHMIFRYMCMSTL